VRDGEEPRLIRLVALPRFFKRLRVTTARTLVFAPTRTWLSAAASVSTGQVELVRHAWQADPAWLWSRSLINRLLNRSGYASAGQGQCLPE
jgi:hypothetical protein